MQPHDIIALVGTTSFLFFGTVVWVANIFTRHAQKMANLRAQAQQNNSQEVLEAIQAIRQEVTALRDTTTQYDMSFDSALQRLENRVAHLESSTNSVEQASEPPQIVVGR